MKERIYTYQGIKFFVYVGRRMRGGLYDGLIPIKVRHASYREPNRRMVWEIHFSPEFFRQTIREGWFMDAVASAALNNEWMRFGHPNHEVSPDEFFGKQIDE